MNTPGPPPATCTAFDGATRIAAGSLVDVAISVKEHLRAKSDAAVLIFADDTGKQIDFDLRGTDQEIGRRLQRQFGLPAEESARPVGRPKLGVVAREVTLMPVQWEWLAGQAGGTSSALRRLVEEARRAGPDEKARRRQRHERAYTFMSAMAGDRPHFEEASRALFADDAGALKKRIAAWPADIRDHVLRLYAG